MEASRELFNNTSVLQATTATIAQRAGINDGLLYYHFKRKQDILLALVCEFEEKANGLLAETMDTSTSAEPYISYVTDWLALIYSYRFLWQSAGSLDLISPGLARRVLRQEQKGLSNTLRVLDAMRENGLLTIEPAPLKRLAINVFLVISSWHHYIERVQGQRKMSRALLADGVHQVVALVRPHLSPSVEIAPESNPLTL